MFASYRQARGDHSIERQGSAFFTFRNFGNSRGRLSQVYSKTRWTLDLIVNQFAGRHLGPLGLPAHSFISFSSSSSSASSSSSSSRCSPGGTTKCGASNSSGGARGYDDFGGLAWAKDARAFWSVPLPRRSVTE